MLLHAASPFEASSRRDWLLKLEWRCSRPFLAFEAQLVPNPGVVGRDAAEDDRHHERRDDQRQPVGGGVDAKDVQDGRRSGQCQQDEQWDDHLGAEQQAAERLAFAPLRALDDALDEAVRGQRHEEQRAAVPGQRVDGLDDRHQGQRGHRGDHELVDDTGDPVEAGEGRQVDVLAVHVDLDVLHNTPRSELGRASYELSYFSILLCLCQFCGLQNEAIFAILGVLGRSIVTEFITIAASYGTRL